MNITLNKILANILKNLISGNNLYKILISGIDEKVINNLFSEA